jgi:hypothetical protein
MVTDNPLKISDLYHSAINSSNLRDETRVGAPRSNADILKAVAWSKSKTGFAIDRLQSEYASRDPQPNVVRLPSLSFVLCQVALQAKKNKIDDPETVAFKAIIYWLTIICQKCKGTKEETIPNTNRQSGRFCKACKGTGKKKPESANIENLSDYIQSCLDQKDIQARDTLR